MQIDYKRDLNHTYVILQEEKEPDTASYQIRMLLTNTIPGLLDCKIGKMDDKTLFYYEVTSKQSLQSVFEQRSIGAEALRKLFEQLLDLLEELGQYLLAPDGLVLQPELVFADANLENFSFCYLPGKQGHTGCFQKQIRELMEYLPNVESVSVVPVGLSRYREGLYPLEPFNAQDAGEIIDLIEKYQKICMEKYPLCQTSRQCG